MPRKKSIKQPRPVSTEKPFGIALRAAERRLARAIDERALAMETVSRLNVEIPSLERTVSVLGGAPTVATHIQQAVTPINDLAAHLRSIPDRPLVPGNPGIPAIPYKEPNFSGMGSVPALPQGSQSQPELTEEELLPEMGEFA